MYSLAHPPQAYPSQKQGKQQEQDTNPMEPYIPTFTGIFCASVIQKFQKMKAKRSEGSLLRIHHSRCKGW